MIEQLMAMEGYDKDKNYVVAKHSDNFMMVAKGRIRAGEIPDASGQQDGTMVVWEIPTVIAEVTKPVRMAGAEAETSRASSVAEDLPPVVEPQKPSRLKRALKKLSKKGTK